MKFGNVLLTFLQRVDFLREGLTLGSENISSFVYDLAKVNSIF